MKMNKWEKINAGERPETMGKHDSLLLTMCKHTPLVVLYTHLYISSFLAVIEQLYNSLCLSVGRSVGRSNVFS